VCLALREGHEAFATQFFLDKRGIDLFSASVYVLNDEPVALKFALAMGVLDWELPAIVLQ
jgi:hypothetical protein